MNKMVFTLFAVFLFRISSRSYVFGIEGLPNVVLLVVDNVGISDLGWFGNATVETPNLARLASEGVKFTRWYSQSTSTSSRASILTGNLPIRTGIIKSRYLPYKTIPSLASTGGLRQDHVNLAKVMKNMDYSTAYVGHWGLGVGRKGAFLPTRQGFDRWYGVPALHNSYCLVKFNQTEQTLRESHEYPNEERSVVYLLIVLMFTLMIGLLVALWVFKKIDTMTLVLLASPEVLVLYMSYFSVHLMDFIHSRNCILYRDNRIIEQPYIVNNMTLRFTKETVQLIKVFSERKHPFFIMQSYLNMRKPWYLSHPFSNCSKDVFSCSLQELDWSIGKILKTIQDLHLENNTMVIFTSTGGPCLEGHVLDCQRGYGHMANDIGQVQPLRGGLNGIWEGDIRVPTIIKWKNAIQPGRTINFTTSCMDILPTLVELTNQLTLNNFDGKSLLKILFNTSIGPQHDLVFHYTDIFRPAAVSYGKYKLVLITQSGIIKLSFNMEIRLKCTMIFWHILSEICYSNKVAIHCLWIFFREH